MTPIRRSFLLFACLALAAALTACSKQDPQHEPAGDTDPPAVPAEGAAEPDTAALSSFFDLETRTLDGEPAELADYRGQVVLAVNVASKCGFTPQYEGLQALHTELAAEGFTVLAFPSNDFKNQEPGTPEEIREFCTTEYGVTFPMFEKMQVTGEDKSNVYRFLTAHHPEPDWNFTKYLIGPDGRVVQRFGPRTTPEDPGLRQAIRDQLAARG